jgi:uncharacterized Zn-binding protein involved in type VI secretion
MGQPAAKQGDRVTATDTHLIQPPGAPPPPPVPVPHPFSGIIDGGLSSDVNIANMPAATVQSTATNTPAHIPIGGTFVVPPKNKATIIKGSGTVFINNKAAARSGDTALTCNDPVDAPVGTVVAVATVFIGD